MKDWLKESVGGKQVAENLSWSIEIVHLISPVGGDPSLTSCTTMQAIRYCKLDELLSYSMYVTHQ